MSTSEGLIQRMLPFAQRQLEKMMAARRDRLWGPIDDIKARIRRHPKSGEERVTVVKPVVNNVRLFSQLLKCYVSVKITPEMLREVESMGGIDDYLIKTSERLLGGSSFSSDLRFRILKAKLESEGKLIGGSSESEEASQKIER